MPAPGNYFESLIGAPPEVFGQAAAAVTTYAMAPNNTGFCARVMASSTDDILGVILSWATITTPGTITVRIETIDATTGKPTGTLYDANAVKTGITPTVGIQTITFASAPTTGLVAGTEYALVVLTTAAGTAHTLNAYTTGAQAIAYPNITLTAADGTTRANFAEVAGARPICAFNMEDGSTSAIGCQAWGASRTANTNLYSTFAIAQKMTLPIFVSVLGVKFTYTRAGTPAGDLRVRLFDASNNVITGTTVTIDKDSLSTSLKATVARFAAPVVIGGTIRVVLDSASSASAANGYGTWQIGFLSGAAVMPNLFVSTCPDVGTPVWTDSTTEVVPIALVLNDLVGVLPGRRR